MSNNRFLGVKTLGDLYMVFSNEDVSDYSSLTEAELDRIANVFEANIPDKVDMPDRPLTEAGYTLIWNVTVDTVESFIAKETKALEEETEVTYSNVNMEEKVMGTVKENTKAAADKMMEKFTQAKENIKVQAGETVGEYFERVDDSFNVVKAAFGNVLNVVDGNLGFSAFKESILEIIEAGQNGNSKHDLFEMAKKCREKTDKYIAKLIRLGNVDGAQKLKDLMENLKGESIFTKLFSTLYWMGKKVVRKLRKWFKVDEEKSVIGAFCRSLAGFAGVLREGIKLIWNTAKFAVSFIAAGVITIADIIVKAIMTLVNKIKDWANKKTQKAEDENEDEDEELEEDFFLDDDEDDEE